MSPCCNIRINTVFMNTELNVLFSKRLNLGPNYADKFQELVSTKVVKKNDFLISEGTVCNFLGIIISGSMRSFVRNEKQEFNNDFYFVNDFVSAYNSFLTRRPNACNIQALSDTEIYFLNYDQLNSLIDEDLEWLKLGKYVSDLFYIRKCERETSFLKHLATERLAIFLKNYPGIEQKVSQYHIASYLGIKPETLSRIKIQGNIKKS